MSTQWFYDAPIAAVVDAHRALEVADLGFREDPEVERDGRLLAAAPQLRAALADVISLFPGPHEHDSILVARELLASLEPPA